MKQILKPLAFSALTVLMASLAPVSFAGDSLLNKPVVKQAAVGAAAGVAVGAMSDRATVGKAAATGAVVGAGTGLMSQSKYLKDKPLLRRSLQGAVIGTGVNHATGRDKATGAVVGAGSGAGYHFVKQYLDKK
ncbi:MAG TPA: hypothetical protein V6C99_07625 [Oculatellaceae cyanobacterium]|jgi:hypothetical protein